MIAAREATTGGAPLLHVERLSLAIGGRPILRDVSLTIPRGGTHGLVGESGSGKSLTALAVAGLLPRHARASGAIRFEGRDLLPLSERERRPLRGKRIGMVFQEPMTALNPMQTVERQVAETLLIHGIGREPAVERARAQLARVGLGPALAARYPHQLSGGQRQRVVVAIATVLAPDLVIADEPTTALDVVRQREVLDLLSALVREDGASLLLITHDLAVVAEMVEAITVLRAGEVVETTRSAALLDPARDAYTRALVAGAALAPAVPAAPVEGGDTALELRDITRTFGGGLFGGTRTEAVRGVSLAVPRGGAVGLVGGSGCGKSTLARIALALDGPSSGEVHVGGARVDHLSERDLVPHRRAMQIVFQDPNGSFDPRRRVGWSVAEPLHLLPALTRAERDERVAEALRRVHLSPDDAGRYPHEFSGGQRQRLAIARAVVTEPALVVADEPVSALDVSIRGRVLALFAELRERLGLAVLFISHDLAVVRAVTDEVAVMDRGLIVERGPTADVLAAPKHEATRALVAAAPDLAAAVRQRRAMSATTPA